MITTKQDIKILKMLSSGEAVIFLSQTTFKVLREAMLGSDPSKADDKQVYEVLCKAFRETF